MATSQTVVPAPTIESVPVKVFRGDAWVKSVAFFPGGDLMVTGDRAGEMRIWHVEEGTLDREVLKGHTDWVRCVVVSRDNRWIGSGGDDKKVIVWDTTTRELKHTLEHANWVMSVDFSHDSQFLASGSHNSAHIWDVESGECVVGPITCSGIVNCIRFSPDDSRLATGARSIQIWNARTGDLELTIEGSAESLAWTNDGAKIIAGGTGHITIYDVMTGDQPRRWEAHGNYLVESLSLSPTNVLLASASSSDELALVWNVQTGQQVATYQHEGGVRCIAYSPTGKFIATAWKDDNAYVWEAPHPDDSESEKIDDGLDLPAVPREDDGTAEVGRGEFLASYLDLPTAARPSHINSRANAPQQPAHSSRGIKGIIKGLLTKSPSALDEIELDEIGVGGAGRTTERTRFRRRTLVAASRDLIRFAYAPRSNQPPIKQVFVPIPEHYLQAHTATPAVPPQDTENVASSSTAPGTISHAQAAQAEDTTSIHGTSSWCCF
ncbi:hypothetical protein HYDPIDRAFT_30883 [Hydnomerulius pinastri MD-312]|uniref:Anaphase-promoting complex subunit 4 WD40 domain-containing protein n=1 Tax=Hydnomerulius pinastri MD-312 TaxID=994086 RepID=A0A0C9VUR9_9AGAM|nr:hypothetical protein HYDPIDRAFT_30883 [Hydnomerulius pinastri MD-312]